MSIPAQGAEGAETMTAGQPVIRKAVFEIASRRIKSGAPGLAPATAEAIARIIGLEAAKALASPRADSGEGTAGGIDRSIVAALNGINVVEAAEEYEFCPDEGSHTPTEFEKALLIDFAYGLMNTVHEAVRPLVASASVSGEAVKQFAHAVLHGDDEHRGWLTEAAQCFVAGRPLPEPRGKGTQSTPAQPAGAVPDSLRALLEDAFNRGFDLAEGNWHEGTEWFTWAKEKRAKEIEDILASHPAGQSAGSGAEEKVSESLRPDWHRAMFPDETAPYRTPTGAAETEEAVEAAASEREVLRKAVSNALHDNQFLDGWPEMVDPVVNAVLAARPAAPEAQGVERVRHVKRGSEYEVLGEAEAQISDGESDRFGNWKGLYEGDKLTVYRGSDGKLWCRFTDEFRDGRFVPAPPASSGQGGR